MRNKVVAINNQKMNKYHQKWALEAKKPLLRPGQEPTEKYIQEATAWWAEWKQFIQEQFPYEEAERAEHEAVYREYRKACGWW